jgi:heme-binding protein
VTKERAMRRRRVVGAVLVIVAIASAARSRPRIAPVSIEGSAPPHVPLHAPGPVLSLLRRACFDCHSEQTRWPWYAALPIASHLVERDVTDGRGQLNWSHWDQYNPFDRVEKLDKMCELASTRSMPPWRYRLAHSDARLSSADVSELCAWTRHEADRLVQGGS